MTETDSGAPKPTEEDRGPADTKGDAAAKAAEPSPGDRDEASPAGEDCAIDVDSAHDRAS